MTDLVLPRSTPVVSFAHTGRKVLLAFVEARPVVQIVFLLRFAVGAALGGIGAVNAVQELLGTAAWFAAVWFVYLLNGISDVAGDRRNGSRRPLASGTLDVPFAFNLCLLLAVVSVLTASLLSSSFVLLVSCMLLLGVVYSIGRGAAKKSALFALNVAALGAVLTYAAGSDSLGAIGSQTWAFAAVTGAWIATAGHAKDLGDEPGDRESGRRTLPILLGGLQARAVIAIGSIAVGAAAVAVAIAVPRLGSLLWLAPGAVALWVSLATINHFRASSKAPYRTFMLVQYIVNLSAFIS
ncbi:UbiA family prenyltransferase [Leifsonia sp. EB34]|uniref:UbiA family prenyltransferase n=1 Tax=Leifsonia sp. EB34 TaxID=3156303 RepID=UPI0035150598